MQHLPAGCSVSLVRFLSASCLLCLLPVFAASAQDDAIRNTSVSDTSSKAEEPAAAEQPDAHSPAEKKAKDHDSKYDLDRIGRRGVGGGWNTYSLEKERALGETMASVVDQHNRLLADPVINDYVNAVAQKLVRNSDAEIPFTVKVIDSPESGIFSLPGGFLYINKGLIEDVENEAELAGLMAHEIAHVTARHFTRTATRAHTWNLFSTALIFAGPVGFGIREVGGIAAPLTFRKMSRDAEREADLLGIQYLYTAGYDPEAFVHALERLHHRELVRKALLAHKGDADPARKIPLHSLFSKAFASYPATQERIERVQQEISTWLPPRADYEVDSSDYQDVRTRLAAADAPILRHHRAGDNPGGPTLRRVRLGEDSAPNPNESKALPASAFR
jgi:beta-barrel assembly-enhancing protease